MTYVNIFTTGILEPASTICQQARRNGQAQKEKIRPCLLAVGGCLGSMLARSEEFIVAELGVTCKVPDSYTKSIKKAE